jgi:hypothetical protein
MYAKVMRKVDLVFNDETIRSFLDKFRYAICAFFLVLLLPQIQASLLLPGFLVSLFGESIQILSFGSLNKNRTLATRGLYSLTRNPMYIGRFFLLLGGLLLIGRMWIIPVFTVLYYFYMINRVKREETNLREIFGEGYESYCCQVNRFVPSFNGFNWKSLWYFRWNLLVQNHGHWNFAGVLSIYLLFYVFTFAKMGIQ